MDAFFATRRKLTAGLIVAGAIAGGIVGAALTIFGKIVAGAPPATPWNYAWNMVAFGIMGAVAGPIVTWNALRDVPLWRTVVEPLVAGIGGAAIAVLLGSGTMLLVLPPVGVALAVFRLHHANRHPLLSNRFGPDSEPPAPDQLRGRRHR